MPTEDELSETFAALADPTRRAILARLAQGEATVLELAEPFQLSLPAVSKHLKVLQRAGLISQSRRAQWRPCRLEPARLKDVSDWVERYRAIWEDRFGRLDQYLRTLQVERAPAADPSTSVSPASSSPRPMLEEEPHDDR
jgi:DNA-binding transcriptional ArsR family regulator